MNNKQKDTMRIIIVGAGAMGSLFGAMLSSKAEVHLIDNYADHIRAVHSGGLTVEAPDGSQKLYRLSAVTDARAVKPGIDLAIIFTKSYETRQAALTALPLLHQSGKILSLQNGLGNVDEIADVCGIERTIAGVTSHGGTLLGPGRVRHAGKGPTFIASAAPDAPPPDSAAHLFQTSGIDTQVSDSLDELIWGKLVINVGINALAAILRTPNGILPQTPQSERIMECAVREAVEVARALGISLPYPDPLEHVKKVCELTATNRASMLQDILRGAKTEINVINRAIVRKGETLGIATPYNRILSDIIEALEATAGHRCK